MKLTPLLPKRLKRTARAIIDPSLVTKEQTKNHRHLSPEQESQVREALRAHYFSQPLNFFAATPEQYLASPEGQQDMADHVFWRTNTDRGFVVPWLASALELDGCRILEIGCGTGASTVALAEQGCRVIAVDVNQGNIRAAERRCRAYDLKAEFTCCNAVNVGDVFRSSKFDLIVFFATLEHLTYAERLVALKSTWNMLEPGAFLCVVETPNRLWWFDNHTAFLPFFHWLPDDLALDYAPHSKRAFMKAYESATRDEATNLDFARRGRGVSYHEFDLTLGDAASLDVVSALDVYARSRKFALWARWAASTDRKYEKILRSLGPKIHRGFYQPHLNLLIRKH